MTRKSRKIEKIMELMHQAERIRNCSLIGHVDHGKTTLSDSLLSSAGLLNPDLAGIALVLDFLDEEQERGITMKAANISLVFDCNNLPGLDYQGEILVNLVDTPGHVDFSGKVTRALRLIDIAIVVVDAVEGIMIQTEHVTRQALENAVRPLLYINKVDRLIKELGLGVKEIQQRFKTIIEEFNELIKTHARSDLMRGWQVNLVDGTVAFGSALDGWGATLSQFLEKFRSFDSIMDAYLDAKNGDLSGVGKLKRELPIHEAIFHAIIKNGPSPLEAQQYRVPFIWHGNLSSDLGKALQSCNSNGPVMIFISRVQIQHGHVIATGRVFSGKLKRDATFLSLRSGAHEKSEGIGIFMGHRMVVVDEIPAGNIVAIKGLKNVQSGETLLDAGYAGGAGKNLAFDQLSYLIEPVITVSVEPERLVDLKRLEELLIHKSIEDPNIKVEVSNETGEILVSGIGPLHLEVFLNEIKKVGMPIIVSDPIAIFYESIELKAGPISGKSSNMKNEITMNLSPLLPKETAILQDLVKYGIDKHADKQVISILKGSGIGWDEKELESIVYISKDYNVITIPAKYDPQNPPLSKRDEKMLIKFLSSVLQHGPLVGEPIRGIKISIDKIKLASTSNEKDVAELIPMIRGVLFKLMESAKVSLIEPIFESTIYGPIEYLGKITSILSQYNGRIDSIQQESNSINIRAYFPVRCSFKMIDDARTATSGHVIFQNRFFGYEKIPNNEFETILEEIRVKKGML
ncbi:MAG: GTP-binding protein [Promethearchaeota archaeon]